MVVLTLKHHHQLKDLGGDDTWLQCNDKDLYVRIRYEGSDDPLQFCPKCGVKLEVM